MFRIEDTDAARDSAGVLRHAARGDALARLRLGRGPGGRRRRSAPYRQSERYDIYADVAARLLEAGRAYHCYCSQDELDERNERARAEGRTPGYDGHCRVADRGAACGVRRPRAAVRWSGSGCPTQAITFDDLVRGEITFQAEHVPDYVLVRGNGHPLYTLVNPVDDALMEITHVLRGEDLLSSTPRQLALYDALAEIGVGTGRAPRFGHLPYVMGQGNKKLSKRDPESNLLGYRDRGFLPEGLLNYLALLGWAIAEDRDIFSMEEMVEAFTIERVNPNPARFDLKKAEAINAVAPARARRRGPRRADGALPAAARGCSATRSPRSSARCSRAAAPLVQERMGTLAESVEMLGFLFVEERRVHPRPRRRRQAARDRRRPHGSCRPPTTRWPALDEWETTAIDEALRERAHRGAGAQAAQRLRRGAGGGHRSADLAAALRVAGAAGAGAVAAPPRRRRGGPERPMSAAAAVRAAALRRPAAVRPAPPYGPAAVPGYAAAVRAAAAVRQQPPAQQPAMAAAAARLAAAAPPMVRPRRPPFPHPEPREYHQMFRTWSYAWWRPVVGHPRCSCVGMLIVVPLVLLPGAGRRASSSRAASRTSLDAFFNAGDVPGAHAVGAALPQPHARRADPVDLGARAGAAPPCGRAGSSSVVPKLRWGFLFVVPRACPSSRWSRSSSSACLVPQDANPDVSRDGQPVTGTTLALGHRDAPHHAVAGGGRGVRLPRLPPPGRRLAVAEPVGGASCVTATAVRAGPRLPEPAAVLRPVHVRRHRRLAGDPHRRAGGGDRAARAQQLPGVRLSR